MNLLDALALQTNLFISSEIWISIRTDGVIGSGTRLDPFNGSSVAMFDTVLLNAANNCIIHLGPGVYRTNGGNTTPSVPGFPGINWAPKLGQKIIGSGIFATTIRFVWDFAMPANRRRTYCPVCSFDLVDYFEMSDLTIDANVYQQFQDTSVWFNVACLAVNGSNISIRRVRMINFGTRTPFYFNGLGPTGDSAFWSTEGFPARLGSRFTIRNFKDGQSKEISDFNPVFEDCIMEMPDYCPGREITCVVFGGGNVTPDPKIPTITGEKEHLTMWAFGAELRDSYLGYESPVEFERTNN